MPKISRVVKGSPAALAGCEEEAGWEKPKLQSGIGESNGRVSGHEMEFLGFSV